MSKGLVREHGTVAGYWQHYKREEPICDACREAQRSYHRRLRAANPQHHREWAHLRNERTRKIATRTNRAWTPEEDAVVLSDAYASNAEKAIKLGRSEKAVKHRAAYLRNPPPPKPPKPTLTCEVGGCEKVAKTRKMCSMHYARFRRHGTPEPHGLNRLGCECDVCKGAREQRLAETRKSRQKYDSKRKSDDNVRRRNRERARQRYIEDEDYRRRVLSWQKENYDTEKSSEYSRRWKEENPEKWIDLQKRMIALKRERNRDSRDHAHNHFKEWTGPELELVAREELTLQELSEGLGRTIAAVAHARNKVRKLPREILLAGLSRPKPPRQHGTNAGYWQHYKRGEEICEPCWAAHREYDRNRYARKRRGA